MLVGQAPGREEDEANSPFVGPAGRFLDRGLKHARASFPYRFENAVRCYPAGDRKPRQEEIEACLPHLVDAVRKYKPPFVGLLGGVALKAVTGESSIMKWAGFRVDSRVPEFRGLDFDAFAVVHPAAALRDEKMERQFFAGMDALIGFAARAETRVKPRWRLLETRRDFVMFLAGLAATDKLIGFDIETTELEPGAGEIVGAALAGRRGSGYVDFRTYPEGAALMRDWMKEASDGKTFAIHNAKFEIRWLRHHWRIGIGAWFDTCLADHLLYPERAHGLKQLAYAMTGLGGYEAQMQRHINAGGKIHEAPREVLAEYCCGDAEAALKVAEAHMQTLSARPKMNELLVEIVEPFTQVVAEMESAGFCVDQKRLALTAFKLEARKRRVERRLQEFPAVRKVLLAREKDSLNPRSTPQVSELLREVDVDVPDTRRETLLLHAGKPEVAAVVEWRQLAYTRDQIEKVRAMTEGGGMLRSRFRQDYVVSGRLSSEGINLLAVAGEGSLRSCIISRFSGGMLVEADFSQEEVRVLANLAGDKAMLALLSLGKDPYTLVASETFEVKAEKVTVEQRKLAKGMTLGTIYGISAPTFARKMKIPDNKAQRLLHRFRSLYPDITAQIGRFRDEAVETGYITAVTGRRRWLPGARGGDRDGWQALLQAGSFPIQGASADIVAWATVRVRARLRERRMKALIINQIYDSILLDAPRPEVESVVGVLRHIAEEDTAAKFGFLGQPLKVTVKVGKTWADIKEVEDGEEGGGGKEGSPDAQGGAVRSPRG